MDPEVLRRYGAHPGAGRRATVQGWRIGFTPYANLIQDPDGSATGIVYDLPNKELDLLYGPKGFVTTYQPLPVLVDAEDGSLAALTFIEDASERAPDPAYVENYLAVCRRVGLPRAVVEAVARQAGRGSAGQ